MEVWFVSILLIGGLFCLLGVRMGRLPPTIAHAVAAAAAFLIVVWSTLINHPEWFVKLAPSLWISRFEGIGAAPLFLFITGVLWSMGRAKPVGRERHLAALCAGVCVFYLAIGGAWMLLPTSTAGLNQERGSMMVMQSRDYTCVPAATATLLNRMGVASSEQEMAALTFTRPRSGSTMLKAMEGVRARLEMDGRSDQVRLLAPTFDELRHLPYPMLTTLRFHMTSSHMVVLLSANEHFVSIFDPEIGIYQLHRLDFEPLYGGRVVAVWPSRYAMVD